MTQAGLRVAVVGATGAVGKAMLSILSERKFPVRELVLYASERSLGKKILFQGRSVECQVMKVGCFKGVDIAFFDASDAVSKQWVPEALKDGVWVVDHSAVYRMENDVPLLVPELNAEVLEKKLKEKKNTPFVVSGPNCSTVQLTLALQPIQKKWGLKHVVVSTYQSTSGAGLGAMQELKDQTVQFLNSQPITPKEFAHPIAFNCIPQIGSFLESGFTTEETKLMEETKKILQLPELKISATAVRVPTLSCHSESVWVECDRSFSMSELKDELRKQSGLVVMDGSYPMPVDCAEKDAVFVGRLRKDPSVENGMNFWIVSDNLRKGAALNAVQIGEVLLRNLF